MLTYLSNIALSNLRVEGDIQSKMSGSRPPQRHGDAQLLDGDLLLFQTNHHVKGCHGCNGQKEWCVPFWDFS